MIQKVAMIILMQPDLNAGIAFYEKLGFKTVFSLPDKWAEMELGSVKIGLCPTSHQPNGPFPTGIVLQVEDLKALYQEHKDRGIFLQEPLEKIHGIMISIQDPGMNVIDLYQPTPEKVQELARSVAAKDEQAAQSDACCGSTEKCC